MSVTHLSDTGHHVWRAARKRLTEHAAPSLATLSTTGNAAPPTAASSAAPVALATVPAMTGATVYTPLSPGTRMHDKRELDAAYMPLSGVTVSAFGAKGDGVTDDTSAIQAAANAVPTAGGILLFPPGVYVVHVGIAVHSNTLVRGAGATLLAAPSGFVNGPLLRNVNSATTTLTDHDIAVRNLTFDYGLSGADGGAHLIDLVFVRNAAVSECTFQCRGAGDAVALIGCYNTLIDGCTAYEFINCAYDHWWGPQKARVVNCYAESASSAQIVNFNPDSTSGTPSGLTARGFILANNTLVCTGPLAIPMQIEPLGSGFVSDVVIHGNTFLNVYLVMRGAVSNANVAINLFDTPLGGNNAITVYPQNGGNPANITIIGNTIVNPATGTGAVGVIRFWCNSGVVANNIVIGTTVEGLDCSSYTPIVCGNSWSAPSNVPYTLLQNGATRIEGPLVITNVGTSPTDLTHGIDMGNGGQFVGLNTAPANGFIMQAGGGGYIGFYIGGVAKASVDAGGGVNAVSGFAFAGGGPTWTTGSAVPSSTQPVGSLYSRVTTWTAGATLYVSKGGGAWTPVASV